MPSPATGATPHSRSIAAPRHQPSTWVRFSGPCLRTVRRLSTPDIRVVDGSFYLPAAKRDPKAEYANQHIPGAVFFDIDEIADTKSKLPHMLPPAEKFASRMQSLGLLEVWRRRARQTQMFLRFVKRWNLWLSCSRLFRRTSRKRCGRD